MSFQDMAVTDAIHHPSPRDKMVVAEVLCDSQEEFAKLDEVITGGSADFNLKNAEIIVKAAREYVERMRDLISENVGEYE